MNKQKFGTAPVFFTAISTILGAIMFLRFGFAVGMVGLAGTIGIILIGHAVTIPTAMAIAEIATNQKVEGGGEYYIISRSFGLVIGSTIGIALYMSQAISVAFYIMAFTEAFKPLLEWVRETYVLLPWVDQLLGYPQTIGIPALLLLTLLILTKGADLGVKVLYFVVATLALSLLAFFVGTTDYARTHEVEFFDRAGDAVADTTPAARDSALEEAYYPGAEEVMRAAPPPAPVPAAPVIPELSFFTVFAIIFPAFTGMTAGVGLSGDLRDPGRSIPRGTLAATIGGMIVYIFMAWKLADSAPPEALADTSNLIMADIAWQGWWIIPLGLAAATISSALGSILVAPRTLQAIAADNIFPATGINQFLARGKGARNEPYNASLITVVVAAFFILLGALDSVAEIISMFFMVTYGSLCLISFLNHFAADPSYRPTFRSKWYVSLFGAIACFGLMFFMNSTYAAAAVVLIGLLYLYITHSNPDKRSLALIFQGVIFQVSRRIQIFLQKAEKEEKKSWRPSVIAVSDATFTRLGAFDLLRWLSQKYGFGTYLHYINGYLSHETSEAAAVTKQRIIRMAEATDSRIYVDTIVSPSYTSAIAQIIQFPGIAGTENNLLLLEYSKRGGEGLDDIIDNFKLIKSVDFNIGILGLSERGFGLKRTIHIWITRAHLESSNLMILLAYVMTGHSDWKNAEIKLFAVFEESKLAAEQQRLYDLIETGKLPISRNNIEVLGRLDNTDSRSVIASKSGEADLVILGFRDEALKRMKKDLFAGYDEIGNVLFVHAAEDVQLR
ncbi:amino acid transporter [Lewinella marina]|uniref:Amino acid permease n=1 Tax=Neolewinella marina TaxID=438751 RepID=A0A2G0CC94_9BACT|nr:amino acid permease [Neolewinella marina]NJB86755.1 amino acid transporter [Neolewinella marina]PHK97560.1 amino acid permease [Neolewinella marina]